MVRGGILVSGNYFSVLGVEPKLGRGFREAEDEVPGRDAVVVLGTSFWKREFAGDPSVVGRTVRLNGVNFTVIGVAPESFPGMFIFVRPDFYVPLRDGRRVLDAPAEEFLRGPRRSRAGRAGAPHAGRDLGRRVTSSPCLAAGLPSASIRSSTADRGATVRTQFEMRTQDDDVNWKFGVIFTVLALAVLLVACTNAAGLLLSRARTRTREIAVRLAIGAGRFRLIRLLLTESLVLARLGGLARHRRSGTPASPRIEHLHDPGRAARQDPVPDGHARAAGEPRPCRCSRALFCGLAPALQSTRTDLVSGLKSADVDEPGRRRLWGRNALVVTQVAMSLMLLAASFLMFRGFQQQPGRGSRVREGRARITS